MFASRLHLASVLRDGIKLRLLTWEKINKYVNENKFMTGSVLIKHTSKYEGASNVCVYEEIFIFMLETMFESTLK